MQEILEIFEKAKVKVPQILGLALFDKDGLMLVSSIDIPDYDEEAAAAFHADLWYEIKKFVSVLPDRIEGPLKSVVLELGEAYLQIEVIGEYGIMGAITRELGLGALRRIIDEIKPDILKIIGEQA